jgi:hypothetical protein
MESPVPLLIEAVLDEAERPALTATKEQLEECLGTAAGIRWPIRLVFRESVSAIDWSERPTVVLASFLPMVARRGEPISSIEARWRTDFGALMERAVPAVFVCTVFRYVANEAINGSPDMRLLTVERIRRLNLLAAELSHDVGISVIDFDRVFAHFGARALRTDFRLAGAVAAEVAAHTTVSSILAAGLDDFIPPDVQERAKAAHGGLGRIDALIAHRLEWRQST